MELTKQGSTLVIRIKLKIDGQPLDINVIESVEFVFGRVTKIYPIDVKLLGSDFIVNFTQEDTMKMAEIIRYQVRVKFKDGQVKGSEMYTGKLKYSLSREIL